MAALLADLEKEFGSARIFRPNRDIRFSADKSPYKTVISAVLDNGGYIQFSARGLGAGNGMHMMTPDQLDRYRKAVADDVTGVGLEKVIAEVESHQIDVTGHDTLKSAPRGYPRDHPRVDLLRHKGLIAWKEWPVKGWLGTPAAKTRVVDFLRASKPLHDWLDRHVGGSLQG